jgi:hypothetical protein
VATRLSFSDSPFAMRRSPVRSRSRPPNYFGALRKPDAPSGFRRSETGRVGLYFSEFREAWDSPTVGDSIRKLRESDLLPQPFSIPASRTLDDSCCG